MTSKKDIDESGRRLKHCAATGGFDEIFKEALAKFVDIVAARIETVRAECEGWYLNAVGGTRPVSLTQEASERIERELRESPGHIEPVAGSGVVEEGGGRKPGVCERCGWTLCDSRDQGCVPGDCSYRPHDGTPEYQRMKERDAELQAQQRKELIARLAAGYQEVATKEEAEGLRNSDVRRAIYRYKSGTKWILGWCDGSQGEIEYIWLAKIPAAEAAKSRIPEGFEACRWEDATKRDEASDEYGFRLCRYPHQVGTSFLDLDFQTRTAGERSGVIWLRPARVNVEKLSAEIWRGWLNIRFAQPDFADAITEAVRNALTKLGVKYK